MNIETHKVATDPQQLAQLLVERANAGDVGGMVELYEPDAVLATGSGNLARGSDQIRSFYTQLLASGVRFHLGEQRPAMLMGSLALTSTRLLDGSTTAEVARQQPDGSWRWAIDQPAIAV